MEQEKMIEKNMVEEIASCALGMFIKQCGEMAEQNWCKSQTDMLERLFEAVLKGCKYDEWEKENYGE